MLIHEKYIIIKKGFNPPFMGINPEKWPKILISKELKYFLKIEFSLDFRLLELRGSAFLVPFFFFLNSIILKAYLNLYC